MPRVSNLKKTEHILGGGLRADGIYGEDVVIRPGASVELSDADFKRHDSPTLRAMVEAGDLALGDVTPKKVEAAKTSNAPPRDEEAEAEAAEIVKNVTKSRK